MKEQSWIAGVAWLLLTAGSMQAENIALNLSGSGFPDPTPSDVGWGMGSNKWDINDGKRFLLVLQHHFFGTTFGCLASQVFRCESVARLLRARW